MIFAYLLGFREGSDNGTTCIVCGHVFANVGMRHDRLKAHRDKIHPSYKEKDSSFYETLKNTE